MAGKQVKTGVRQEGDHMQRLNSFEDFQASRPGRHGPPLGFSRFGEISSDFAVDKDSREMLSGVPENPSPMPSATVTSHKRACSQSAATTGPSTPVKLAPSPPSASSRSERRPARSRALSETDGDFMARQVELCAQHASPATAGLRRWRRATDGGESMMQAVIFRRNLKHLQTGPEVNPSVWPHPPPRRPAYYQRRHTVGGVIEERPGCELTYSRSHHDASRVEELQDTLLALSNKLSTTTAHEAQLQKLVAHLQTRAKAAEATSAAEVDKLREENAQLRNNATKLSADLERKSQLLEQVSATFPAYVESLSSQHLGPLQTILNKDQIHTLLEMLCLGADARELHLLLLGESETGVDILPYLHLCGRMRRQFSDADAAIDAISDISDTRHQQLLTRESMAKLLQGDASVELLSFGLDRDIVHEVSSASNMDPWTIVNLLDGRVMRTGTMNMRLAISLAGALRSYATEDAHSLNEISTILSKLAAKCALSPLRALQERNNELESTNTQLEAELEDMRHLLHLKQSNWKAEKLGPKMSPDLWRVDSVGTSGAPSPSSPAPSPLGAVF